MGASWVMRTLMVFKETQNILKERQILELHIFNGKEGLKCFSAETDLIIF